jgi:hypothetical protein
LHRRVNWRRRVVVEINRRHGNNLRSVLVIHLYGFAYRQTKRADCG